MKYEICLLLERPDVLLCEACSRAALLFCLRQRREKLKDYGENYMRLPAPRMAANSPQRAL